VVAYNPPDLEIATPRIATLILAARNRGENIRRFRVGYTQSRVAPTPDRGFAARVSSHSMYFDFASALRRNTITRASANRVRSESRKKRARFLHASS
jgi:hypothetical protein